MRSRLQIMSGHGAEECRPRSASGARRLTLIHDYENEEGEKLQNNDAGPRRGTSLLIFAPRSPPPSPPSPAPLPARRFLSVSYLAPRTFRTTAYRRGSHLHTRADRHVCITLRISGHSTLYERDEHVPFYSWHNFRRSIHRAAHRCRQVAW